MNREAIAHYLPLSVFLRVLGASAFRLEAEIETRRRRGRREERGDSFRLVWVRIPNRWGTNVHLLPLSVFLRVLGASAFQFLCLPLARNRLEACFPRQAGSLSYGSSSHRHLNEVHSCSTGKSSEPNWSRAECPDHRWRGHSARRLCWGTCCGPPSCGTSCGHPCCDAHYRSRSRAECPDHRWRGHSARRHSSAGIIGFPPGSGCLSIRRLADAAILPLTRH